MASDPLIGQTVFTAGDNVEEDVWDDSALIEHWEQAKAVYKEHYSKRKEVNAPFGTRHHRQNKRRKMDVETGPRDTTSNKGTTSSRTTSTPMPPAPILGSWRPQGAELDALIQHWFYQGYYAGYAAGSNESA
ncbi:hypothetical protein BC940DRAFT_363897 [Gongronella butleri]|nr:hypothetical protein BC940DRAFT_363897 [Gongronella butleri]